MIRPLLLSLVLLTFSPYSALAVSAFPRVFDTGRGVISTPEAVFEAVTGADAVFLGEQHDDDEGHRFQLALLKGLAERRRPVVLVMEMFERDVQAALDAYLSGQITEAQMLDRARPWPNYAKHYRPLVEFARAQGWPVKAGNAPRPLAARIAQSGLATLARAPAADRRQVAAELRCGRGPYRDKFMAEMREMGSHGGASPNLARLFESQCAKDETMAETVAAQLAPGTTVVHLNGAFHSDEGLGVVERLRRRRPDVRTVVVSIGGGSAPAPARRALGDFVVWTR